MEGGTRRRRHPGDRPATEAAFDEEELWPAGEWERWQTPLPLKSLNVGAAGVVWALHALRSRGRIRENAGNEAIEVMLGAPGTMLAAAELHRRTGEERWAEAWRESAQNLLESRAADALWANKLYGELQAQPHTAARRGRKCPRTPRRQ